MNTSKLHVKFTFITPVLGSQPQKDIASEYLGTKFEEGGGKLPDDEMETLDEMVQKGTTAFHKLEGQPIFYDYQVKGFLKEAARIFNGQLSGKGDKPIKNFRSKMGNLVFVQPRRIPLHLPAGAAIDYLERPLQAQTAQGPRVAIARSEMLPEGTWFEFDLKMYDGDITEDALRELITYGEDQGLGQWRNGGFGRFTFEVMP